MCMANEELASKLKDTKIDSFLKKPAAKKKEDSEDEDDKILSITKGLGGNKVTPVGKIDF
jgi:hypothetical protein